MNNHQFDKLLIEISKDEEYLRQAEVRLRGVAGIVREERAGLQPDPFPEARLRCQEAEKEIRRRSLQLIERIDAASSTLTDAQLSGVGTRAQVLLKRVAENMPISSTDRLLVLADAYHAGRMLAVKKRSAKAGLPGLLQSQH
jgi:hypothetical protein